MQIRKVSAQRLDEAVRRERGGQAKRAKNSTPPPIDKRREDAQRDGR